MKNRKRMGGQIKGCRERGDWAELYFMMLALEKDMRVSRPFGIAGRYDVGVESERGVVRVQVKSTIYKRRNGEYSMNILGPKRKPYAPGTVDFFAVLLIPIDDWYIIPFEVLGRANSSIHITPKGKRQKYGRYREAWELLRGQGSELRATGSGSNVKVRVGERNADSSRGARNDKTFLHANSLRLCLGQSLAPKAGTRNDKHFRFKLAAPLLVMMTLLGLAVGQSLSGGGQRATGFGQAINAVQTPTATGTNGAAYVGVLAQKNMLLSGQTVIVGLGNSTSGTLYLDTETGSGACTPAIDFAAVDAVVASYPTNLLLAEAMEGGTNTWTPQCVWSQAQADASYLPYAQNTAYLPGEYIFQSGSYWQLQTGCWSGAGYDNTCTTGGAPASFAGAGPVNDGTVVWVKTGAHAPLQDGYCGGSYQCGAGSSSCYAANGSSDIVVNSASLGPCSLTELYESEPVPSELPLRNWASQVVAAAISHYNGKVGYVRVGSPAGGELSPIGVGSGLWPNYGSTAGQQRAQYLSWVKKLDAFVASAGATMRLDTDLNCAGDPADCAYADQEAQLAHDNNFNMMGTNGYQVNDVLNLEGLGTNNCTFPLSAAAGCTSGDWAYNCSRFTTNAAGNPMGCLLQTLTGTTVMDCAAGLTGPIAPLPAGSTYCPGGFPGLLPLLVSLCKTGVGSPNQKVCVQTVEVYTNGPSSGAAPAYPAGDILLALDMTYSTTTNAVAAYAPYQLPYASAFGEFLAAPSVYGGAAAGGGTGANQMSVLGRPLN